MILPEPVYRNSAGRLLAILSAIPNGQLILDVVPRLFGNSSTVNEEKQKACLAGLIEINNLYLEFRKDITEVSVNEQQRDVILSGLASIQQSIYPINLHSGFRALTEAEKSLLAVAATIIPQEDSLQENDIKAVRDAIASLRNLVEKGDFPKALRNALLELIRLSEDAISRFNIRGARGFKKAFKAMLGEVAEAYALASGAGESQEIKKSTAWTAILKLLTTIDAVASKLLKYKPILDQATNFLLSGPHS